MLQKRKKLALFLGSAVVAYAGGAASNTQAQDAVSGINDTIVVTAQKREQDLQDVPVAITVLNADLLDKLRVEDFQAIALATPGLQVQQFQGGFTSFTIRGISTGGLTAERPVRQPTVGLYFDELPLSFSNHTPPLDFYDIERVEVLKGPQGTLFGSDSLSGTIRVITKDPQLDEYEAGVQLGASANEVGGFGYEARGYGNFPIVEDKVGLRVIGYVDQTPGFTDNIALGKDEADESLRFGGRAKLLTRFTDRLSAELTLNYNDFDTDGLSGEDVNTLPAGFLTGERLEQYREVEERAFNRLASAALEINYDLGFADMLIASSYSELSTENVNDFSFFMDSSFGVPDVLWRVVYDIDFQNFTQEVRWTSPDDQRFRWIAGLYYAKREQDFLFFDSAPGFDDAFLIPGFGLDSTGFGAPTTDQLFFSQQDLEFDNKAAFAEASFDLTDRLTATAGLRYYDYEASVEGSEVGFFNGGVNVRDEGVSESGVNPRFLLEYRATDDILLSAQAARGFRLGGYNFAVNEALCGAELTGLGVEGAASDFESDSVWDYELNAKTAWLDNRLIVNASAYHIEYNDLQQTLGLSCGFEITTNIGKAEIRGVELESQFALTDALSVRGLVTYLDTEVKEGNPDFPVFQIGDELPNTAEWSYSALVSYEDAIGGGQIRGFADAFVQGVSSRDAADIGGIPTPTAKSYVLAGMRLGVREDVWEGVFFVDNIFDKNADLAVSQNPGRLTVSRNAPRTYGFRFSRSF